MKNEYEFNNSKYIIDKGDKDSFDYEVVKDLFTEYFNDYDYVLGDIAYNKLRLKGFCDKNNKKFNKTNDIKTLDNYINNYCAYNSKWFLLKKLKNIVKK